jgi:DNA-nicking Smr family endonuclease
MSGEGGRKGRRLSQDEHSLWQGVTRAIAPLRKRVAPPEIENEKSDDKPASRKPQRVVTVAAPPPKPKAPAPTPLDRRLKQKIARGNQSIDARLDLHGMTQAQAHAALSRFLRASQAKGATVVLVITGKGMKDLGDPRNAEEGGRGVLKRMVPMWLKLPELSGYVVGFGDASKGHGGEGALYVRLRKRRD